MWLNTFQDNPQIDMVYGDAGSLSGNFIMHRKKLYLSSLSMARLLTLAFSFPNLRCSGVKYFQVRWIC